MARQYGPNINNKVSGKPKTTDNEVYNNKEFKLTLTEACSILNEGQIRGSYETNGNTVGTIYNNGSGVATTSSHISASTYYMNNPLFVTEERLKEYCLQGIISYQEFNNTFYLNYNDILELRTKIREMIDSMYNQYAPYRKVCSISLCVSALTVLLLTISALFFNLLLESPLFKIGVIILLISSICAFIANGQHNIHVRSKTRTLLNCESISKWR